MPEIVQSDFSLGWRPSDDTFGENQPKNSLLRMQNLKLDETGALTLIPGSKLLSSLQAALFYNIYSKIIGGIQYIFCLDQTGAVACFGGSITGTGFADSPGSQRCGYTSAFNSVIVCNGGHNWKFNPPNIFNPTGGTVSTAPNVTVNNAYSLNVTGVLGNYTPLDGTVSVSSGFIKCTPTGGFLVTTAIQDYFGRFDTTNLSGGSIGQDSDTFVMNFKALDTTQIGSISVLFKDIRDISNYFEFKWDQATTNFNVGSLTVGKLQCNRGDFKKFGSPGWDYISQVVVSIEMNSTATDFYFNNLVFSGGNLGVVDGTIEYIQVLRNSNLNPYTSLSSPSPITTIYAVTTTAHISTIAPNAQWDGVQVYRRGGGLDKFYLIYDGPGTVFDDTVSDQQALLTGITLDERERSLATLIDPIWQIVGPFFNRWLYFSPTTIYISFDGNPENYLLGSGVLTPYGAAGEIFMWAEKFGNSAILVGTSNDIYEITGTLTELPDGTIDVIIRPTGCRNPPINDAHASTANELYYVASDGIRQVNPSGNSPFWVELDALFKGKIRYGVQPPKINGGNVDKFVLAIAHNELYFSFVDITGYRQMYAYDLLRRYSYEFKASTGGYGAPYGMYTDENGNLLAVFPDNPNNYIKAINSGTLINGTDSPSIIFRTKIFTGETPRQRKDSYTLKFKIDTGGQTVGVHLIKDDAFFIDLGGVSTNFIQEHYIDLSSSVGIAKSYQLEIVGDIPRFKLTDFAIDYDLRPVPLTYFRSQPTNYGIQGRKILYELPIIIDTLGSPVTMTPIIDNVAYPAVSFSTVGKTTYNYIFLSPGIGRDINYTLLATGTVEFEYYGDVQPRVIEPLPDAVNNYIIQNTNLGTYARKRFIAFAFVIDTGGFDCLFTPKIDGNAFPTKICNTSGKRTYIYYFDTRAEGIDIGGTITGVLSSERFEFYAVSLDECVSEKLPPSATNLVIPITNFGSASKKRIRTIPIVIDTKGHDVIFIPTVDGVTYPSAVFNTQDKRTVLYYFTTDAFGIDVGGTLHGNLNFEYYGSGLSGAPPPEIVESLPVGKMFDQLGPIEFLRNANIKSFRVRLVPEGNLITFNLYVDDVLRETDSFSVTPNLDKVYEIPWTKKYLNGTTCRIELSSSSPFHRFSGEIKVNITGNQTQAKWMNFKNS